MTRPSSGGFNSFDPFGKEARTRSRLNNSVVHPPAPHFFLHGVEVKSCSWCGSVKPLDKFYRCVTNYDGRTSDCVECRKRFTK